jgi:hypothetical protein
MYIKTKDQSAAYTQNLEKISLSSDFNELYMTKSLELKLELLEPQLEILFDEIITTQRL